MALPLTFNHNYTELGPLSIDGGALLVSSMYTATTTETPKGDADAAIDVDAGVMPDVYFGLNFVKIQWDESDRQTGSPIPCQVILEYPIVVINAGGACGLKFYAQNDFLI